MKRRLLWLLLCLLLVPTLVYAASTLSYGMTSDEVYAVQERLANLGFYTDKISGNFLDNTQRAVRDFQRQNGLQVDGVVGKATWAALFDEENAVDAYATPRPSPSPSPVPYRIGVDVTNQITTIYGLDEQGYYTQVIRHMLCSTGTEKDPTPPGIYTLNGSTARWCYFSKWGTHAQYWTRIDAYNAFHSVIYLEPDPMALAVGSYTGLGKRASHGCIRLMIEDAKWIYENCGKGVEVDVYIGEPDEELNKSLKIPPLDYSVMLPEPTPQPTAQPPYNGEIAPFRPPYTLERGVENETVYWVQCKLAEMGYYNGSVTGGYYDGTEEAIRAFQRDHGLGVDGKAGTETLTALFAYAQPAQTPMPMPVQTELPWFYETRTRPWAGSKTETPAPESTQQPSNSEVPRRPWSK